MSGGYVTYPGVFISGSLLVLIDFVPSQGFDYIHSVVLFVAIELTGFDLVLGQKILRHRVGAILELGTKNRLCTLTRSHELDRDAAEESLAVGFELFRVFYGDLIIKNH